MVVVLAAVLLGVPKDGTNWDVVGLTTDWHANVPLEGVTNGHYIRLYVNGAALVTTLCLSTLPLTALLRLSIEWDGARSTFAAFLSLT